ncbi:sigma-70 family RNA polymerase sigma factor [Melittangium boletus]|uniref:sigma-70 family RNA polymerase sigma factor n=1 Tax=Melittangium boletus TaxID=83453 RepID=UPI003DA6ABDF
MGRGRVRRGGLLSESDLKARRAEPLADPTSEPPSAEALERAWVHRVVLRDDTALEALYARLSGTVYAVALAVLRDRADAEEVTQEAFVHLWTHARDYNPARGTLTAWMTMLARSRALDRLRARAHRDKLASSQDEARTLATPPATPMELAQRARDSHGVNAALATLSPEQRQTLELAFHEGLSHSEIAARTGEPLGTVKTRIRRGLERLARNLTAVEGE